MREIGLGPLVKASSFYPRTDGKPSSQTIVRGLYDACAATAMGDSVELRPAGEGPGGVWDGKWTKLMTSECLRSAS